jgi:hypothetical protein
LSIRQPWAELILQGVKTVEVRSWPTKHRGRLWIHAGKRIEKAVCEHYSVRPGELATGALVGWCDLHDCIQFDAATWAELQPRHLNLGAFSPPLFAWFLRSPQRQAVEPMAGHLGLMRLPDDKGGN